MSNISVDDEGGAVVPPVRGRLLDEARRTIIRDREDSYGSPEDSFRAIAAHWDAYLGSRISDSLTPGDIAAMMILLKVARMETGGLGQKDSWLDIAGYAACGWETQAGE